MMLITHDLGVVAETCDKVAIMYAGEIVEYGTSGAHLRPHAHPYTEGLFDSLPSLDRDVHRLHPIARPDARSQPICRRAANSTPAAPRPTPECTPAGTRAERDRTGPSGDAACCAGYGKERAEHE